MFLQSQDCQESLKKLLLLLILSFPLVARAQINADGVISMGRNALFYEDYVLSIQYFNQVIDAKPYLYAPYYYRAVAKYYLGDYMGAVKDCTASIERDPFIDDCYRLRAICYIMTGNYSDASNDYRLLIQRKSEDQAIWYNLVLCQTQQKQFASADSLLDAMIGKWPKYARCYMLKAQIALEQKDTVSADQLIEQTLRIDSFHVDALAAKAMLSMRKDSFKLAEQYYDRAIIQSPRQAGFFLGRALARYQQKKLRGAMDDYNVALDLSPDNYPGHYNRGLLRMQVGEDNLAIEDFDFVLKKEPGDRLALYNRAILHEKTGNYRAAIQDYTTVLKEYPDFLAGYENRARCRRKVGDNALALQDERKVTIAQLDEMYGQRKRPKRVTRKQKEQNIDEYQNLVVEDESDNIAKFYASDYRGRVQNRQVDVAPQPLYLLTFHPLAGDVVFRKDFAAFVENLNTSRLFKRKIYIASRQSVTSEEEIQEIDTENHHLAAEIGTRGASPAQLFALAMFAASKRDYVSALSSLDQALRQDSLFEAALFLRAGVRASQLETQEASQNSQTQIGSAIENFRISYRPVVHDLSNAISVDSHCAYLYYNRGCIYQKMKLNDEALRDYTQAIMMQPDLAEAYYNRGLLYVELNDYSKANLDLGKAGELGLYSAYSLIKHFRKAQQQKP